MKRETFLDRPLMDSPFVCGAWVQWRFGNARMVEKQSSSEQTNLISSSDSCTLGLTCKLVNKQKKLAEKGKSS